jgi:uncharacterized protein with NRDE domain
MCLIAWHWQPASPTPLLLLANRDEFYARPSLPLHWWAGGPVLAGKDLQGGGTWLGVGRNGRLAAITNYRDPLDVRPDAPSRGELVTHFLQSDLGAKAYLQRLSGLAHAYNPFNLLLLDGQVLMGFESRGSKTLTLSPGLGAVSNAGFDTPWPKLVRLKQGLQEAVSAARVGNRHDANKGVHDAGLLSLLQDRAVAPDAQLPSTGIARARERALSAAFIATPDYGTRACSIVRIGGAKADFFEACFDASGSIGTTRLEFVPQPTLLSSSLV